MRLSPSQAATLVKLFNRDNGLEVRPWTLIYRWSFGRVGPGAALSRATRVENAHRIFVGSLVGIAHSARLQALGAHGGATYDGSIHIGDHTSIQTHAHFSAAARMEIGASVLMASWVSICDHEPADASPSAPLAVAAVRVGDFAWLGEKVVVQKGVTIGHHAVIGANSVVTADIPPYAVAAGVPARILRMRTPG